MSDKPAAEITLGGVPFPIGELALRQQRVIYPAMAALNARRDEIKAEGLPSRETFDVLIAIVVAGVSRCRPGFTVDELLDLPGITIPELWAAVPIIAAQAGMSFDPAASEVAADDAGKPAAPSTSTG